MSNKLWTSSNTVNSNGAMNFGKSVLKVSSLAVKSLKCQPVRCLSTINAHLHRRLLSRNHLQPILQSSHRLIHGVSANQNSIRAESTLALKKRQIRKKRNDLASEGKFTVSAYATAEEYDLEALHTALTKQDLYETRKFYTEDEDVLHVRSKYNIEPEARDIFFFREGSIVLWNCDEPETGNILRNLRQFEINPYNKQIVDSEKEVMKYAYLNNASGSLKNEIFYIQNNDDGDLEKYTFSNAMTSSVKLAIWESMLENYIDGLATVTSDLKEGRRIRITRACILRKTGELFALKHLINLDSDLLETPDFYWDREALEQLFNKTSNYFSISKRKKVSVP